MDLLCDIPFELDSAAVLSDLRISPDSNRGRELGDAIEAARRVARPKAIVDAVYVESRQADGVVLGRQTFTSRVLRVNLDGVERVFPFIATCGREISEHAAACDDPLTRFCLDTVMANALGAASRCVREHVRAKHALRDFSVMNPGSLDDWPLTQQRPLFDLFGSVRELIGVELTDSFLMVPIKSVSGIIFPTEVRFESCQLCPRPKCPGRRAPYDPSLWEKRYRDVRTSEDSLP